MQIHAANGYLIDQFLRDNANFRDDAYGGPIENRIRLLREVASGVVETVGAGPHRRAAVAQRRIAGRQRQRSASRCSRAAAAALDRIGIAFLELREPGPDGTFGKADGRRCTRRSARRSRGPLVLNSDYDARERRRRRSTAGEADAIAFGRTFLANPDLPHRFAEGLPLNPDDMATWYSQGAEGYTDYPFAARAAPVPEASAS